MQKFTNQEKNNLFWYFLVPVLISITLIISLSPWFFEFLATPVNRVFSGINRWSVDYFLYLSYVELGRRGQLLTKLLFTTAPQKPVFAHLVYTLPGLVFGKFLGLSSVFIYHLFRGLYGLMFLITTIIFFYSFTKSKIITLLSFLLTFYVSGFAKVDSWSPLKFSRQLDWLQEQNIIERATGPLHYSLGFVFFLLAIVWFFRVKTKPLIKFLVFGLLLNLTLFSNPFSYLVAGFTFVVYSLFLLIGNHKNIKELLAIILGFLTTLPLIFYYQIVLSGEIWGKTGMSPKYYVVTHPPLYFWPTILSIGPIFFLGITGIIYCWQSKKQFLGKKEFIFLALWPIVQSLLFFFGDYLKIHPLRIFSGLYYLPLALFSAIFVKEIFPKKFWLVIFILFVITFPNYYLSYIDRLYAFTNFKEFGRFSYPTKKQVEALRFLEKNSPVGSGLLAMYEISSLSIGFSGNSSEFSLDQQIKARFYNNQMDNQEALNFLKKNHFDYVYFGYQEAYGGGNPEKYPFLKKIFENEEAKIYKVK
ncbi:MAG: hypothetical protein QHH09_00360 [Microgenomates group bacterium]|nr:hypothetical protein [Microgenomates group bacterium]